MPVEKGRNLAEWKMEAYGLKYVHAEEDADTSLVPNYHSTHVSSQHPPSDFLL